MERVLARVCREAGGRVTQNTFVRDLNVRGISADDGRRLEVVVSGLPLYQGQQLALDATLVSPVRRDGTAQPGAAVEVGVTLRRARARKEARYPEIVYGRRCRLVVFAMGVGGRWEQEAMDFVRVLAKAKSRSAPSLLRRSAELAWAKRWGSMISIAALGAVAASLLEEPCLGHDAIDGGTPPLGEVLHAAGAGG